MQNASFAIQAEFMDCTGIKQDATLARTAGLMVQAKTGGLSLSRWHGGFWNIKVVMDAGHAGGKIERKLFEWNLAPTKNMERWV